MTRHKVVQWTKKLTACPRLFHKDWYVGTRQSGLDLAYKMLIHPLRHLQTLTSTSMPVL